MVAQQSAQADLPESGPFWNDVAHASRCSQENHVPIYWQAAYRTRSAPASL